MTLPINSLKFNIVRKINVKIHQSITNKRIINGFNRFCTRVKEIHGYYYDYSKVIYKYSTSPVTIICPLHGEFKQPLSEHCKGRGCPECGKEQMILTKTTPFHLFKKEADRVHKNKYTYNENSYTKLINTVVINCPIHGEFKQRAEQHIKGSNCPQCAIESSSNKTRWTKEQFIEKAIKVHGNKYDYSKVEYKQNKILITITCPKHGDFKQTPHTHTQGSGCLKCRDESLTDTTETFITKAQKIHGNLYSYDKVNYIKSWNKVLITCLNCGDFKQTPNNHLQGKGCKNCGGYGFNSKLLAFLYYLKVTYNNQVFYKIGITNRTVNERFGSDMQYIQVLHKIHYKFGQDAYNEEQRILKQFKDFKYIGPDILKSGNTELFTTNIFGYDQSKMVTMPNNADLSTIVEKLNTLKD